MILPNDNGIDSHLSKKKLQN